MFCWEKSKRSLEEWLLCVCSRSFGKSETEELLEAKSSRLIAKGIFYFFLSGHLFGLDLVWKQAACKL